MKKFFFTLGLLASVAFASFAANVTYVLLPNGQTNTISGPLLVTKVVMAANGTNTTLYAFDSVTNTLSQTISAYTNITYFVTNDVVAWTNYYGAVNTVTNNASLHWQTNSVAASTNTFPRPFNVASAASTTTTIDDASYFFLYGLGLTNNSTGTATITVSYQK